MNTILVIAIVIALAINVCVVIALYKHFVSKVAPKATPCSLIGDGPNQHSINPMTGLPFMTTNGERMRHQRMRRRNKNASRGSKTADINPRTNEQYKSTKAQREASKKWNEKHPERNSTESHKRSIRKYNETHVALVHNGKTYFALKAHCHREDNGRGRMRWVVNDEFRNKYAWLENNEIPLITNSPVAEVSYK